MNVWRELGVAGARQAAARGDVVVLVDVLRASVTITVALSLGASRVLAVESLEEARSYLSRPGFCVAGERNTLKVPGFDFGNSPAELLSRAQELRGKSLLLTTSNGTRCVAAAREGAKAILVGCLPNAHAVVRAAYQLAGREACDVALLAAGQDGEPAAEDEFAVALLARELSVLGAQSHVPTVEGVAADVFGASPHGQKLARLGYGEDVALSARMNILDTVGVFHEGSFVPRKAGEGQAQNVRSITEL